MLPVRLSNSAKALALFAISITAQGRVETPYSGTSSIAENVALDKTPENQNLLRTRELWDVWRAGHWSFGWHSRSSEDESNFYDHPSDGGDQGQYVSYEKQYEEDTEDIYDNAEGEDENEHAGKSRFGIVENARLRWLALLATLSTISLCACCGCALCMKKMKKEGAIGDAEDLENNNRKVPLHIEADETTVESDYFTRYELEEPEVEAVAVPATSIEKQKQGNVFSRTFRRVGGFKQRILRFRSSKA